MTDLPAGAEGIGGLVLGAVTTLGVAAAFLRNKTEALKTEAALKLTEREEQTAEHQARLELLAAEKAQMEGGGAIDVAAMVTAEVQRLLPEAVSKIQEEERLRVALEREKEHELMERLKKLAIELNAQRGGD